MTRRGLLALLATLFSWVSVRLNARQNAVKGSPRSEDTGESGPFRAAFINLDGRCEVIVRAYFRGGLPVGGVTKIASSDGREFMWPMKVGWMEPVPWDETSSGFPVKPRMYGRWHFHRDVYACREVGPRCPLCDGPYREQCTCGYVRRYGPDLLQPIRFGGRR